MKKIILITGVLTSSFLFSQDYNINVTFEDRTGIAVAAAEYNLIMREQREKVDAVNREIAHTNFDRFNYKLDQLAQKFRIANNKEGLKRIETARKKNDELIERAVKNNYAKLFYKLQAEVILIEAMIN